MPNHCSVDGCDRLALRGDLCSGHTKMRQRTGRADRTLRNRRSPWGRLVDAAITLVDVDSEDDHAFKAAEVALARAARAYAATPEAAGPQPVERQNEPDRGGTSRDGGRRAAIGTHFRARP